MAFDSSLPLISVVIPVHNGALYLQEAIESVRSQNYSALQIVVIDDGSTDQTAHVAAQMSDIEYSYQAQSGAATARNNGVLQARGKYIAFLDADDLWTSGKLQLQIEILQNGGADIVFGQVEQFLSPDCTDENSAHVPEGIMPAFIPSAMMLRREAFLRVGFFETSWQIGEFIDWFARATERGLTHCAPPQIVLRRRVHRTNQGVSKRQFQSDYVRIIKASLDRRRQSQSATSSTRCPTASRESVSVSEEICANSSVEISSGEGKL